MPSFKKILDALTKFTVCAEQNPFGALCLLVLGAFVWDIWR